MDKQERSEYIVQLGSRIKYLRELKGMTQQELAEKVGFKTASAVNKIELGLRDINQKKIMAFAQALDVSPSYLIGVPVAPRQDIDEQNLISMYRKLNQTGKMKAIEFIEDLVSIEKYKGD